MELTIENLVDVLTNYFSINKNDGTYTYELTRVKEAFDVGTMTINDFAEWGEEEVNDLANYLHDKFAKSETEKLNDVVGFKFFED